MAFPLPTSAARMSPILASLAAIAATLALGRIFPAPAGPGLAPLGALAGLPRPEALAAALGTGLIAWHLARLSAPPAADPLRAACQAALIALLAFADSGAAALAVPAMLTLALARRSPGHRVVALMVHCGAAVTVAGGAINQIGLPYLGSIILCFSTVILLHTPARAANDNPSMERNPARLIGCWNVQPMIQSGFARFRGKWGVS